MKNSKEKQFATKAKTNQRGKDRKVGAGKDDQSKQSQKKSIQLPIVRLFEKITNSKLNRLGVGTTALILAFCIGYTPCMAIITFETFGIIKASKWLDFFVMIPVLMYVMFFEGFIICNISPTHFQFFKSLFKCTIRCNCRSNTVEPDSDLDIDSDFRDETMSGAVFVKSEI